jgi:hypothetical protein
MKKSLRVTFAALAVVAAASAWGCGSSPPPSGSGGADDVGGGADASMSGSSSGFTSSSGSSGTSSGSGSTFGSSSGGSTSGGGGGGGGPITCDPTCAAAGGTCSGTSCTIVENPAAVSAANQTALQAGGTADSTFGWLYPYDKTVFPRGLVSPTLQFAGAASDAEYVHITGTGLDYKGYISGGAAGAARGALSQNAWDAVTHAVGATSITIQVSKISGSNVSGPIKESWTVAQGSVRGTIYHETYDSPLAGSVGIMEIQAGATKPTVLKSGCGNVCHSASADGSTLVADVTINTSASYDLKNNAALIRSQSDDSFAYGGLYPDGSIVMSSTTYLGSFNSTSQLYDTHTGAVIKATGWDGVIKAGGTTSFSTDGKQIAFVHEDKDNGHTLAKMDFDRSTTTFSNLIDVATDSVNYLAWPAFTPDGASIIYHAGSSSAFQAGYNATADLYIVNLATMAAHRLDALDGYTGSGSATYLPSMDTDLSATPNVLPVAVGGYFWVAFTSHRAYGSLLASKANGDALGKLWVAAIDINAPAGTDPSHPAFYLDGQELNADNLRAFWTLPPCEANGAGCTSGDQCCTGFCRGTGSALVCVPPPSTCSNEYEKCTKNSDCCMAADQCIGGFCGQAAPPR